MWKCEASIHPPTMSEGTVVAHGQAEEVLAVGFVLCKLLVQKNESFEKWTALIYVQFWKPHNCSFVLTSGGEDYACTGANSDRRLFLFTCWVVDYLKDCPVWNTPSLFKFARVLWTGCCKLTAKQMFQLPFIHCAWTLLDAYNHSDHVANNRIGLSRGLPLCSGCLYPCEWYCIVLC